MIYKGDNMVLGLGMDLIEIEQISKIYKRSPAAFVERLLTKREFEQYQQFKTERRKIEWLAGRFAAKEAASKAVGTGIMGLVNLHDFEIIRGEHGKPALLVSESILSRFSENISFHLSITHSEKVAGAVVILEKVL